MRLLAQFKLIIIFFYEKVSHAQKSPKSTKKHQKAQKALKGTKTLRQQHKNTNKRISDYFPLTCF